MSGLADLFEAASAAAASGRGLPPVHLWHPANCGEIDIRIRPDGTWLHEGTPIGRPALVRLFSTVLRRDEDGIYLVTPAEKLKITVEDAPFLAVGMAREGEALSFVTNVGDVVQAGPEHPIRVESGRSGEPRPYVHVRGGLEALIARAVFYDLVELGEPRSGRLQVRSNGCWFDLGALDA
jgi:hypothetical protein